MFAGAWSIVSAPLILGMNLSDAATLASVWPIISNTEAIAVNQAYAGYSGSIFWSSAEQTAFAPCGWWLANCSWPSQQYLYKPLPGGDVALLLMNNGVAAVDLAVAFANVPGVAPGASFRVRDVWAHADLGVSVGSLTARAVEPRDSAFFRFSPA